MQNIITLFPLESEKKTFKYLALCLYVKQSDPRAATKTNDLSVNIKMALYCLHQITLARYTSRHIHQNNLHRDPLNIATC